jgi:hypothetical protein
VRERCTLDPNREVECDTLYQAWVEWCLSNGNEHPGPANIFSQALHAVAPQVETTNPLRRDGERNRYYRGIALNPPF